MGWLTLPVFRLEIRLHLGLFLACLALWFFNPDLVPRYALLLSVLFVHEVAHGVASLALGARSASVSIWPLFGRANVEAWTDRREAWVALAGPLANLVVAGLLALFTAARPSLDLAHAPLRDLMLTAHLAMGVVNLIPIPPIDGGRVVRALRRGA